MAIVVIEEDDIILTGDEDSRLRFDYSEFCKYYSGPDLSYEQFVRQRLTPKDSK